MMVKMPKTEEEGLDFIRRTGLIGLSLTVLYILYNVLILDVVTLSEPNRIILFIEIGLVFGFLGSAFVKPRVVEDEGQTSGRQSARG